MKKLLLATLLMSASFTSQAKPSNNDCKFFGQIATKMMEYRQTGTTIFDVMKMVDTIDSKTIRDSVNLLAIEAYKVPQMPTEKMEKQAISEFGSGVYLGCIGAK